MSETVTAEVKAAWFAKRFGVTGNQPITERHGADWRTMSLGGCPIAAKGTAEFRAAHLALPRGRLTPEDWLARIDALEAGATSLDDLTN
jgi:hypothetical protein